MEWIVHKAQSLIERSIFLLIRRGIIDQQVYRELHTIPFFKRRVAKLPDSFPSADTLLSLMEVVCDQCNLTS